MMAKTAWRKNCLETLFSMLTITKYPEKKPSFSFAKENHCHCTSPLNQITKIKLPAILPIHRRPLLFYKIW